MGGTIVIAGLADTDKVPGGYGEVIYATGAISASDIPLTVLLVGLMTTGTATADQDIIDVFSEDIANAAFGARSMIARMCRIALRIQGITLKAIAVAGGGGASATATFTVTGTATSTAAYNFRVAGELYSVTFNAGDSVTTMAQAIRDAINQNAGGPCTAANTLGVCTATVACAGPHGNDYIAYGTQPGNGVTVTIAGGATVTGGGVKFTGGTTQESVANVITVLANAGFDRIGLGQNDATNLGRWLTAINGQAAPTIGIRQHAIAASIASTSTVMSLASTTLNNARFQIMRAFNCETHWSEIAAVFAASRASAEQNDPGAAYDGYVLPGVYANANRADWDNHATQVTLLNNGVTPVAFTTTQASIVRSIVTHCLNGSTPDYRVLDTSDAYVPDFVLLTLLLVWTTEFLVANPRVRDNPADEEPEPVDGVAYPDLWNRTATNELRKLESAATLPFPIITNVTQNLPTSSWNSTAKRIMCACNVLPMPTQHQLGISVRQRAA